MRLYFINRYFYPDHSASSQMLSDLVFALAQRGHRITVITSRLNYDDPTMRLLRRETVSGVDIVRLATTGFGRAGLVGRAADYATFGLAAAWLLVWRLRRGDVVVTKTDPPLLSLVTTPIVRLRSARAVNWLQDVFPEVATALGMARGQLSGAALATLRWLRNRALRKASLNIAIGDRMATEVRRLGVAPDKIRVIPNWSDARLIRPTPAQHNRLRAEWGLQNKFVVGYSGNLGRAHDVSTILDAIGVNAREARASPVVALAIGASRTPAASDVPVSWLFVGGGAQLQRLKAETDRCSDGGVMFQPYQPREMLSESLSVPDVHLITLRPALEGLIVPSKYYGIAAAGRPAIFIGDPDGEIARILKASDTGIVVAEGDGPALMRAVRDLASNPERCEAMGRRARGLFEAKYDFAFAVEAWEDAISALMLQQSP
jgi:colanic acid biosynthesis glycosyl transferase WcaI